MADNLTYNIMIDNIKNGNTKNLYLFFGSETLLINDVLSKIEQSIINQNFKSLNYTKLDGSSVTYDELVNACDTMPFMDNVRIVVINDCIFFKSKKTKKDNGEEDDGLDEINSYITHLPDTTVLIMVAGEEVDKRKKLYNFVKRNGDIAEFGPLKGQELSKWIIKEFSKFKKSIGKAEVSYFIDRISGSLEEIKNEINKIVSYAGREEEITKHHIDSVASQSIELNIFQLVDSIALKNPARALLVLNELLLESQPVIVILSMIIRQFRLLLNIKLLTQKGYSSSEVANKLGVNPFVVSNLHRISGNYSESDLQKKLKRCLDIDLLIKNGRYDERIAVESLIVEFTK